MLSGKLLPVHPHPLPGELFSSWFTRIAQGNGLKTHSLALHLWDNKTALAAFARDIDNSISIDNLALVAKAIGTPLEIAKQTITKHYQGIIVEKHHSKTNMKCLLSCGVYHRSRTRNWIVYCPLCLSEDSTPYFRLDWRLSFYTVCPKHNVFMLDQCVNCSANIQYLRIDNGKLSQFDFDSIIICPQCHISLSEAEPNEAIFPTFDTGEAYKKLLSTFHQGWIQHDSLTVHYSFLFFEVLNHLSAFLRSTQGKKLSNAIHQHLYDIDLNYSGRPQVFSFMPIYDRHRFLMATIWLLLDWPHRFIECYKKSGLGRSRITRSETFPYWFESMLY